MLPEFGFFALLITLASSLLLAIVPILSIYLRRIHLAYLSWNLSYSVAFFATLSLAFLMYTFAFDDFSVQYVAQHSNSQLPLFFKLAATWGGHEGSMLFWVVALSLWTAIFAFCSRSQDPFISLHSLAVLGAIIFGFVLFILFLSNPFERIFPVLMEGRDLNPMLQDIGLIFHPPLLYLGYVGFAVNFAITIAALISGQLDAALARMMRPWVLVSWCFLTLGIVLGSWWAYYELGWGGWWFWDPVENASLMPWLLGLALLHSLTATEQRGIFSYWTILFSLLAFSFSLLGTFIVRSGVLTSVHAFAVDGQRGTALLVLFFLLSVGGLSLFALKAKLNQSAVRFAIFSKENALLILNILLSILLASVFLGTFYPIIFTALQWGSISVGAPYFNSIFVPLFGLVLVLLILVLSLGWKKRHKRGEKWRLILLVPSSLLAYWLINERLNLDEGLQFSWSAYGLLTLSIWVVLVYVLQCWRVSFRQLPMLLAHLGVAITAIGAVMSSYFSSEIGVRLAPEQTQTLGEFQFQYIGFSNELGANYTSEKAHFIVKKGQETYAYIYPERRYYDVRTMNMSEVGMQGGLWGDIYIVMGEKVAPSEFTFRLQYKPFVRWLWFGGLLMALGGCLSLLNFRRKGINE